MQMLTVHKQGWLTLHKEKLESLVVQRNPADGSIYDILIINDSIFIGARGLEGSFGRENENKQGSNFRQRVVMDLIKLMNEQNPKCQLLHSWRSLSYLEHC